MRIGILETGKPPKNLIPEHKTYPGMFRELFAVHPDLDLTEFDLENGSALPPPQDYDGWLITGSPHGVYDNVPWIPHLFDFIRGAKKRGVPTVGICFGHQAMVQALEGKAEKSDMGWGVGMHKYEVTKNGSNFLPVKEFVLPASHQDQVTKLPQEATLIAGSPFCKHAAIAYFSETPDRVWGLSFQGHPEFLMPFQSAFLDALSSAIPSPVVSTARTSLEITPHRTLIASTIANFYTQR